MLFQPPFPLRSSVATGEDSGGESLHALKFPAAQLSVRLEGNFLVHGMQEGKAYVLPTPDVRNSNLPIRPREVRGELTKFSQAVTRAKNYLAQEAARSKKGTERSGLIAMQETLLTDQSTEELVSTLIQKQYASAGHAITTAFEFKQKQMAACPSMARLLPEAEKIKNVLLNCLEKECSNPLQKLTARVIVVAGASDLDRWGINPESSPKIAGWVVSGLSPRSHLAVLLKEVRVPVCLVNEGIEQINSGDSIILDGLEPKLMVRPSEQERKTFLLLRQSISVFNHMTPLNERAPVTACGEVVSFRGSVALAENAAECVKARLDGIGLFRTDFMFPKEATASWPTEDQQKEIITSIARAISPQRLVTRTFDLGVEGRGQSIMKLEGAGGAYDLRGIRFALANPAPFREHLRAHIRAADEVGNVSMLFPMVNDLSEFRDAKKMLNEESSKLLEQKIISRIPPIKIGAMLETPAAVLCAREIAHEADFLCIGSNDLIQYILAVSRDNPHAQSLYAGHHPAVVRSIRMIAEAAREEQKDLALCGAAAASRALLPLWLGVGIRNFTVTPDDAKKLNTKLAVLSIEQCKKLVHEVEVATSARESYRKVTQFHESLHQAERSFIESRGPGIKKSR